MSDTEAVIQQTQPQMQNLQSLLQNLYCSATETEHSYCYSSHF